MRETQILVNGKLCNLSSGSQFNVFVPRSLDGIDIKAKLQAMQQVEGVAQGKPVEQSKTHRPMFVFMLEHDANAQSCGYAFDIPTVIGSCAERAKLEGLSLPS